MVKSTSIGEGPGQRAAAQTMARRWPNSGQRAARLGGDLVELVMSASTSCLFQSDKVVLESSLVKWRRILRSTAEQDALFAIQLACLRGGDSAGRCSQARDHPVWPLDGPRISWRSSAESLCLGS